MLSLRIYILLFLAPIIGIVSAPQKGKPASYREIAQKYAGLLMYDSAAAYYTLALNGITPGQQPELYCSIRNRYAESLFWQDKQTELFRVCLENIGMCTKLLGPKHVETGKAMMNFGTCKFVMGGHGVVSEYFVLAYNIFKHNYGDCHPLVAKAYEWLGTFHEGRNDTATATKYLWKSLNQWEKLRGSNHTDLAEIYRYFGLYYKRFTKHDSALVYLKKSKHLFDQKYGEANFQSVKCLNNLADIYAEHTDLEHLVIPTYEKCHNLIRQFPSPNRMAQVMTLYNEAEYARSKCKYFIALQKMNEILKCYFPEFNHTDINSNPENIEKNPFYVVKLATLFKAQIFNILSKTDSINRVKYLEAAANSYLQTENVIDEKRKYIVNLDDILIFSNMHARIFDAMSVINMQLFTLTNDQDYLANTLRLISKKTFTDQLSNSNVLAWKYNDIPNEIIETHLKYQQEINVLKAKLLDTEEADSIEEEIAGKTVLQDLFNINSIIQNRHNLLNGISPTEFNPHSIQAKLDKDECLFLFSERKIEGQQYPISLSIIAFNDRDVIVYRIESKHIFELISAYSGLISIKGNEDAILRVGSNIYNTIFKPFTDIIEDEIIIVPSPFLATLPFETLPDIMHRRGDKTPWLIENHLIRKEFNLLSFLKQRPHQNNIGDSILAVSPVFDRLKVKEIALLAKRDSSLINLPGAVQECNRISDIYQTKLLTGRLASESAFKEICRNYNYIHLSTHGVPANNNSETIQLAFTSNADDGEDGWLGFYEILNLHLKAELVVLSACKTGIGKVNNGEGSLNLAWAFRQAGAKSAVVSLWDANDYASSQIMPAFYTFLKEGQSKAEALRNAKLKFVSEHDEAFSHPYFWAGFDFIGVDYQQQKTKKLISFPELIIYIFLAIAILSLLWFVKFRM